MSADLQKYLDALKRGGLRVPAAAEASIRRQLAEYGAALDARTQEELFRKFLDGLKSIVNPLQEARPGTIGGQTVTVGETPASIVSDITKLLHDYEDGDVLSQILNLRFKFDVATRVMRGAGHFLTDQTDVDEYPAWEFHRLYERDVPRGYERKKGALIPVPDDDWPSRWAEAGAACGDDDWLEWEGDDQDGRGVALKSSGIWQQLGSLRDDTLGNPFYPFAFNSGFGTDGVPYNECVELGLIKDGDQPEGAEFDWGKLFTLPS